ATGHPVEFFAADLEDRDATVAGGADDLGDAFVDVDALGDVQGGAGHVDPQGLHDGVAADEQLGGVLRRRRTSSGCDSGAAGPAGALGRLANFGTGRDF